MAGRSPRLGERLIAAGKLEPRLLDRALAAQNEVGDLLGRVLVQLGMVAELDVAQALSEQRGWPLVHGPGLLGAGLPPPEGLAADFLRRQRVVYLGPVDQGLQFATATPQDSFVRQSLELALDGPVVLALALETELTGELDRIQNQDEAREETAPVSPEIEGGSDDLVEHLRDLASEAPVIQLVNRLFAEAVDAGASDIHLEAFEDGLRVRLRVDGLLCMHAHYPIEQAPAVASRIKLLGRMNIAERRLPQDGRIEVRQRGRAFDLRVSTVPTAHGESLVMRLLERSRRDYSLADVGFAPELRERFERLLVIPHGILLITGPTGSGKTTTLYGALSGLNRPQVKIITVEDPVEYQLAGVNQIQVLPQIGLSFANALRAIVRQDPDIIMIGEMRDLETAQIAIQSALTGHLVLSTLHTNNAVGAITRLQDMGVPGYLLTSTINGVLAQRLVRRLCPHCRTRQPLSRSLLAQLGLSTGAISMPQEIWAPRGCEVCRRTGYIGRTAVHELLVVDDEFRRAVLDGHDASVLMELARRNGMRTLLEDGIGKAMDGETSLDEVLRVTHE